MFTIGPGCFHARLLSQAKIIGQTSPARVKAWSLRMDDRRRDVLSDTGVQAAPQFAVANAVEEVNHQADPEPNAKPDPCLSWQAEHERDAKNDAENRERRHHRHPKRPWPLRRGFAQHVDAEANQNEGEERADVGEIGQRANVGHRCDSADYDAGPDRSDVRRAKARMNS